jgi:hypothetical protein
MREFCGVFVWIVAGARSAVVLDLLDQKARVFYVLIVLIRWFLEHARKVYGKITVST